MSHQAVLESTPRKRWSPPITTKQCACGRNFETKYGRICEDCRAKVRVKKPKYVWTPEREAILRNRYDSRIKGRAAEIASVLGWPKWIITKQAQNLGLSVPALSRKNWTEKETAFVLEWAGRRSPTWIARRLKRSITSVVLKFKRMKISQCIREGYTARDLALCFGNDSHVIERWIREGKLQADRRETLNEHNRPYQIQDDAVVEFIRKNPTAFRLDKVDQLWFMDLVIGGGLLRRRPRA